MSAERKKGTFTVTNDKFPCGCMFCEDIIPANVDKFDLKISYGQTALYAHMDCMFTQLDFITVALGSKLFKMPNISKEALDSELKGHSDREKYQHRQDLVMKKVKI